jgi:hypothetical protein
VFILTQEFYEIVTIIIIIIIITTVVITELLPDVYNR